MYKVFLSNHGYFNPDIFLTFQDALSWAKDTCFEVSIWEGESIVATWSPISGTTLLNVKRRTN